MDRALLHSSSPAYLKPARYRPLLLFQSIVHDTAAIALAAYSRLLPESSATTPASAGFSDGQKCGSLPPPDNAAALPDLAPNCTSATIPNTPPIATSC